MGHFTDKLSEIAGLFDGELKLDSKSTIELKEVPDYIILGRSTTENRTISSPGVELVYRAERKDLLAVYAALVYKLNKAGCAYPHDLVVAADFHTGRINEVLYDDNSFLFVDSIPDMAKRQRFDAISGLNKGSSIKDLMNWLDDPFCTR